MKRRFILVKGDFSTWWGKLSASDKQKYSRSIIFCKKDGLVYVDGVAYGANEEVFDTIHGWLDYEGSQSLVNSNTEGITVDVDSDSDFCVYEINLSRGTTLCLDGNNLEQNASLEINSSSSNPTLEFKLSNGEGTTTNPTYWTNEQQEKIPGGIPLIEFRKLLFFKKGEYDPDSGNLTLTTNSGVETEIDLGELLDFGDISSGNDYLIFNQYAIENSQAVLSLRLDKNKGENLDKFGSKDNDGKNQLATSLASKEYLDKVIKDDSVIIPTVAPDSADYLSVQYEEDTHEVAYSAKIGQVGPKTGANHIMDLGSNGLLDSKTLAESSKKVLNAKIQAKTNSGYIMDGSRSVGAKISKGILDPKVSVYYSTYGFSEQTGNKSLSSGVVTADVLKSYLDNEWEDIENNKTIYTYLDGTTKEVDIQGTFFLDPETADNISGIKSIELGSDVTEIGTSAFSGATSLTDLEIPNAVQKYGKEAFKGSPLTRIKLPALEQTSAYAPLCFQGSNIHYVDIWSIAYGNSDTLLASLFSIQGLYIEERINPSSWANQGPNIIISKSSSGSGTYTAALPEEEDMSLLWEAEVLSQDAVTCLLENYMSKSIDSSNVMIWFSSSHKTITEGAIDSYLCFRCKNVILPSSIESIQSGAFNFASQVSNVHLVLPPNIRSMSQSAFKVESGYKANNDVLYIIKDSATYNTVSNWTSAGGLRLDEIINVQYI